MTAGQQREAHHGKCNELHLQGLRNALRGRIGGGFFFDLLHCDTCGKAQSVSHEELGEIHLGFVKGLPGPYAVARAAMDRRSGGLPGQGAHQDAYHAAAEATSTCDCDGRFTYDAPARCPGCRSTEEAWDEDPAGGRCSLTDLETTKRLSAAEALRALYIDFEGRKDEPPVLLGVTAGVGGPARTSSRAWWTRRLQASCRATGRSARPWTTSSGR